MAIVAGFDVHERRSPSTLSTIETGEVKRGRIRATPEAVRDWAGRSGRGGPCRGRGVHGLAVCLRGVVGAGATPHLAEPAETSALRGKKRRAKTDREDARGCATLLVRGPAAGGLDPAGARARVAHPRPAAQDARRRAHDLAAASPGDALSPRRRGRAGQAAERPGPRVPRRARAARRGPRADRGGAPDDRGDRRAARPARAELRRLPAASPVAGR